MNRRVGVCSWSLQPDNAADLARKVEAVGVRAVQLAVDPLRTGEWNTVEAVAALRDAGIEIRSGMMRTRGEDYATLDSIKRTGGVRLDKYWDDNMMAAGQNAELARKLGIDLVTLHAGFIPHERGDPVRAVMIERLRAIADQFAVHGVRVGLETGQETADTLLDALDELDRPDVGVNFDPANMILYGMGDPVGALAELAPRVVQIHIKDSLPAETPGSWGSEVPVGSGQVDWPAFFAVACEAGLTCDFMIEREAGGSRTAQIRQARELVESFIDAPDERQP